MACFLVPMALAIVMTSLQKASKSLAERLKLTLLNAMLWGGVFLLALEHLWHGEVVPWPPFLTAMANPINIPIMVHEMLTVGTAMSLVTLAVWGAVLTLSKYLMPRITIMRTVERAGTLPTK